MGERLALRGPVPGRVAERKRGHDGGGREREAGGYVGEFRDGQPHGQGVLSFGTGECHEGAFRGGKAHGRGIRTFPNGSIYECDWRDGTMSGQGFITWPDGTRLEGEFVDGVFVVTVPG